MDTGAAGRSSIDHTVEVALYRLEKSEEQTKKGRNTYLPIDREGIHVNIGTYKLIRGFVMFEAVSYLLLSLITIPIMVWEYTLSNKYTKTKMMLCVVVCLLSLVTIILLVVFPEVSRNFWLSTACNAGIILLYALIYKEKSKLTIPNVEACKESDEGDV